MEIKDFVKDEKFIIPENEIDNIYVWTRISSTQEALLSSQSYYKLAKQSFEKDTERVLAVLREKLPAANRDNYQFCDFVTFAANKYKIFNKDNCFVYMTNMRLLNSLACYLAHTMNKYLPEEDSLASLIINKIDEPDRFTKLMDSEFVILNIYAPLPEHKYRNAILDMLLARRSKPHYSTLIFVQNTEFLINDSLVSKDRAKHKNLIDISPLASLFEQRRKATYQQVMQKWYEMMNIETTELVYSKEQPKVLSRKVDRYNEYRSNI